MKPQYRTINRYFKVISKSLFRIDGKLSYARTLEAIIKLAQEVHSTDTDETVWSIGEFTECTLDSLIIGAYWFMCDYHGGQNSPEYLALSVLGQVFKPGCSSGPEDESTEKDVYEQLVAKSGYPPSEDEEDEEE